MPAVVGAGLRMTALPLASAGPTYSTGMFIGKFQGVIATTTPRGWRNVITRLRGSSTGMVSPVSRRASAAASRKPAGRRADLTVGLGPGLAVLDDEVVGQLVATALDDVGHALELGRALEGGAPAVALERLVRQLDRPLDVAGPGRRDLGRRVARRRAHHDRGLAVCRRPTSARRPGADDAGYGRRGSSSCRSVGSCAAPAKRATGDD